MDDLMRNRQPTQQSIYVYITTYTSKRRFISPSGIVLRNGRIENERRI